MKPNTNGSFYAIEKSDVKFSCNIRRKGREVYQVHWEKDNKTLRAADHKQVTIERRWLKIKNVERDDAGLYSCIVLNKCGGSNVVHIRLYIRECKYSMLCTSKPYSNRWWWWWGGERFRGHPRLNLNNFKTVQVMTAKLSEFSSNLSENILKSS